MSGARYDDRRNEAAAIPIFDVAHRLGIEGLRVAGRERVGPCPVCGGGARADRFSINQDLGVFNCRKCGTGGDGIALAQFVLGCGFGPALDHLVGARDHAPDPEARARARRRAEAAERKRQAEQDRMRARAIADARTIWDSAQPGEGSPAQIYLAARGVVFPAGWPPTLRFLEDHPMRKVCRGHFMTLHSGPAMIAAIQDSAGRITAVHQTWIDERQPGQKAAISGPDGAPMPAKLVRGSKKGGAIRLTAWGDGRLIMGEGIETTGSYLAAGLDGGAAFWAGIDLGNMAGRQIGRNSGQPDLSDDRAFVPPPGTTHQVYLQDGDSAPGPTRAKLVAGLRRALHLRPGLKASIRAAVPGQDFNDMWCGQPQETSSQTGGEND